VWGLAAAVEVDRMNFAKDGKSKIPARLRHLDDPDFRRRPATRDPPGWSKAGNWGIVAFRTLPLLRQEMVP
jgi:hypothetical protein